MSRKDEYNIKFDNDFEKIHKKEIEALSDEERQVMNHVIYDCEYNYCKPDSGHYCSKYYVNIKPQMIERLSEFTRENYGRVVDILVPEEFKADFYTAADNFNKYQYSQTYYRRSYRTKNYNHVARKIFPLMYDYYNMRFLDVHIGDMKNFVGNTYSYDKNLALNKFYYRDDIIAARIDAGDREVIELIKDMITSENNTNILSCCVIRAVIKSSDNELHELLCKLLVAARLSEGLRQAVCENADCGTAEAFKAIVTTVKDNNLIRFPSIKRAVGTWTGIAKEQNPDKLAEKLLDDIIYVLQSRDHCLEYINTTDAVHVYSGLWGLSFYNIEDAVSVICELTDISDNNTKSDRNIIQLMTIGYFCQDVDINSLTAKITSKVLESYPEDYKLFSMFINLYEYNYSCSSVRRPFIYKASGPSDAVLCDKEKAKRHYEIILNMYNALPKKEVVYDEILFPWHSSRISRSELIQFLLNIAIILDDNQKIDFAGSHITEVDPVSRSSFLRAVADRMQTTVQRQIVINSIADKESYTRNHAVEILSDKEITEEEYETIEGFAKYKTADLRKGVITLLKKRSAEDLKKSILRMLAAKDENIRLAALDLLLFAISKYEESDFSNEIAAVSAIESPTDREQILINEITDPNTSEEMTPENGYGIYDPKVYVKTVDFEPNIEKVSNWFSVSKSELTQMHLALIKLIDDNANLQFKGYDGEERLLGNFGSLPCNWTDRYNQRLHEVMPFHELWAQFYRETIKTPQRFWALYIDRKRTNPENMSENAQKLYNKNQRLLLGDLYDYDYRAEVLAKVDKRFSTAAFIWLRQDIFSCILDEFRPSVPIDVMQNAILHAARKLSDEELILQRAKNDSPYYWSNSQFNFTESFVLSQLRNNLIGDIGSDFETNFRILHELNVRTRELYDKFKNKDERDNFNPKLPFLCYLRAYLKQIISADVVYKSIFEIFGLESVLNTLGMIVESGLTYYDRYSVRVALADEGMELDKYNNVPKESQLFKASQMFLKTIVDKILDVELKRGDSETLFSKAVMRIQAVHGMDRLVEILKALGNETFDRSGYCYSGHQISKKQSLSHLLSVCYPDEDDNSEKFAELMKSVKLSDSRLFEIAMFAPQWIDIIEDYLKIDGFKSGCYYFMAHTAESISDKRQAIIAKYTPLTNEELNGGCFDVKWFNEVYEILGDKMFNKIYKSAKYISSSNMHTRARKYADAALGKMNIEETESLIEDKRNKDLLMSLAIIPSTDKSDILQRYEFIQNFLKESRQFGAQRRASESSAVGYALKNLAVTAGYSDETRLTLSMETELVRSNGSYFEKNKIGDYDVWIAIDNSGNSVLKFEKGGKPLKSAPAAIKKNEEFISIKTFCDKLKQQYRRTVKMFEAAMEERDLFTFSELLMLCENPVTRAITENLVFVMDEVEFVSGFVTNDGLADHNGNINTVDNSVKLRVAHPFDLYKNNVWPQYQQRIMEHGEKDGRKQPFRQVFRELYVKLDEELDKDISRIFAGYQIQTKRTVGALKSRRWIADYEDGLQKVYYKDNIIAEIYAVADWFSPSDIEAPTLEGVTFTDRKTYQKIKIKDIPDIVYSEIMRDVDLAVSVAHAGGVDPETSHSTIEMRKVIIDFNIRLFGIKNVTMEKNHAFIDGKYGRYTIHLGSGVIHLMGGHQINVTAVSSGKKSKIFLPFIDEDPKTAEIMTKIITFSQDNKIKDPFIMEQIKN